MTLTVELPNDLATREDPAREALEAVAVEAFRTGALTRPEATALLGMGRIEFDGLLKKNNIMGMQRLRHFATAQASG